MTSDKRSDEVVNFWAGLGPEGWYAGTPEIDAAVRAGFEGLWAEAAKGRLAAWEGRAEGALALILLLDQFPRNMFRDAPESFVTDPAAVAVARRAIAQAFDHAIAPPLRQFFYLPFMHAEDLEAQETGINLFETRMPGDNIRHAKAHRDVIAAFGRFPWRNAVLGRASTAAESSFLAAGGYRKALEAYPPLQGV